MKRFLLTNDDGINAEGLIRLAETVKEFGEVWVVAPDSQRSSISHAISFHQPIELHPCEFPVEGVHAYSCTGTPSDCVRAGALYLMPEKPFAVLSGINRGYNAASDIQYSGTCGAAFEGAFQGIHSIAVSEQPKDCHDVIEKYLKEILTELLDQKLEPGQIYNVNFPACPLSELKGVKRDVTVSDGYFYSSRYKKLADLSDGGICIEVDGESSENGEDGTDLYAISQKYITIGIVNNIR